MSTVLLHYCLTVLLSCCVALLLAYWLTGLLSYRLTVLLSSTPGTDQKTEIQSVGLRIPVSGLHCVIRCSCSGLNGQQPALIIRLLSHTINARAILESDAGEWRPSWYSRPCVPLLLNVTLMIVKRCYGMLRAVAVCCEETHRT